MGATMIYILDRDPSNASKFLSDTELIGCIPMIASFICGAFILCDGLPTAKNKLGKNLLEVQNPMSVWSEWAARDRRALQWSIDLLSHTTSTYQLRFDRLHHNASLAVWLSKFPEARPVNIRTGDGDPPAPPQKVPAHFRHSSAIEAYRRFFFANVKEPKWSHPDVEPQWFTDMFGQLIRSNHG